MLSLALLGVADSGMTVVGEAVAGAAGTAGADGEIVTPVGDGRKSAGTDVCAEEGVLGVVEVWTG